MALAKLLKEHHTDSGLSLSALCERLADHEIKRSRAGVHHYIRGTSRPTTKTLHALVAIWGLSNQQKRTLFEAAGYLVIIEQAA